MSLTESYAVVGLTMVNPDTIPTVLSKITPQDLWEPQAETVLGVVADLWADGEYVDPARVVSKLKGSQVSATDVFAMIEQACLPQALDGHLRSIVDAASLRRLSAAGQRIHQLAQQGESAQQVVQHAQEMLDGAIRADDSEVRRVGDTLDDTLEKIRAAQAGETDAGLPTGLTDLDDMLHGLAGGQMIIVAARPGVGKSTLAVDFMRHASIRLGVPSLMFALEMSAHEVNQRILAAEATVPMSAIVEGKSMTGEHWSRVDEVAPRIAEAPIFIDDSSETTIADITAKARLHVEKNGVGLIVVDYLQLLRSDGAEYREQEIASYSRAMKLLAKSTGVPVVVVAQMNRENVRRGGKPQISDLRESGALEQDADVILLLDRPSAADPDERAGEADIIVGKNRRGRTGVVTVASRLHYSKFDNLARGSF